MGLLELLHYQSECALVYTSVLKRIHLRDLKCHLKSKERRKTMTEEIKKLPVAERVEKKMGMARYMCELYFQCAAMVMKDPRHSKLPSYTQTSAITTVFIATKEALDKVREKNAVETAEILESMSKSNDQTGKVA
tara:strand:+ start:117 stop:521 length:405 start_codon:yes stop_codon:yes gene_type:complete